VKITLLADIHGNLPALRAVLWHARGQGADQTVLNLGDLTGYGPNPDEVVHWTQASHVLSVLGDYDQKVLSKKLRQEGWKRVKTPEKRQMFAWSYDVLSKRARRILKRLPEQRLIQLEGVRILMAHGSPASIKDHLSIDTPQKRLLELASQTEADVILCGNSHQAFCRKAGDVLFINPGTVGRPDDGDPRASYAVMDVQDGKVDVKFHRVSYDVSTAAQALLKSGLPPIFAQILRQGLNYDDVRCVLGPDGGNFDPWPNGILTLLTDFGISDPFVGVMKGVILEIAPQARLVDLTHQVRTQNVRQAAHLLAKSIPYFPPGTVHMAVVDPGVGTNRRALAAQIGANYFVAPDNGLLSPILQGAREQGEQVKIVALDQAQYWLPDPSRSFHGRDIFAPVGAHLVNGLPIEKLGTVIDDPVLLEPIQPQRIDQGWLAEVVHVDAFGNLITNLSDNAIPDGEMQFRVKIGDQTITGLTRAFAEAEPGTLIATIDSDGALAISVVNGSAQDRLGADIGAPVEVIAGNAIR
jgi:putative phosphoesterase